MPEHVARARRLRPRTLLISSVTTVALVAGVAGVATGQDPAPATPYPREERWAPTPIPDRVVLTPTETPATSQAVSWRTSNDVETAQAQIVETLPGPSETLNGPRLAQLADTVPAAESTSIQADLGYMTQFHTAVFEGLEPDTSYLYRVGDGANWSEWYEFSTAAEGFAPFSFIYVGDAQNNIEEHVSRVFRRAFAGADDPSLFLHAGDLIDVADRDWEWGEWFEAGGFINGMINTLATPGNHEYRSGNLSPQWRPQFSFPSNGPTEALDEVVYYVDYQGVRFVSIDSNRRSNGELQIQADWLDEVLSDNPNRWTVVFNHHPIFSVSQGRNEVNWRNAMLPVIERHGVDLVLQGHDHSYGRGNVSSRETRSGRSHDGPVYVVSVSGPKMYQVSGSVWSDNNATLRSTAENTQLYQYIDVDRNELRYEARDATGAFHDGFTIRKQDNGRRTVTDVFGG